MSQVAYMSSKSRYSNVLRLRVGHRDYFEGVNALLVTPYRLHSSNSGITSVCSRKITISLIMCSEAASTVFLMTSKLALTSGTFGILFSMEPQSPPI